MPLSLRVWTVGEELVPRRGRRRDPGVLEGLRVVPEADEAEVERHAVVLAVDLVHAEGARVDRVLPGRDVGGDVLDQAGLDLLAEAAAAPRLEQVGHVALLQQRRQLGLERLVLVDLDVDRDVRVRRHVLVGQGLPQAEARVVVLDVVPGDGDRLGAACDGVAVGALRAARRAVRSRRARLTGADRASTAGDEHGADPPGSPSRQRDRPPTRPPLSRRCLRCRCRRGADGLVDGSRDRA